MIPVNEVTYATALACCSMVEEINSLDLTVEDYEFLKGDRLWIATDRARVRRCVEAAVYGAIDIVGFPRFPAPAEFVAAVIAMYVHPINIQSACVVMEGCEFTENVINGVERPLRAAEIFAHVLRVRAGRLELVGAAEHTYSRNNIMGASLGG